MTARWTDAPAMDALDRRLIDALQDGFPLVPEPFAAVAAALGIGTEELIDRLAAQFPQLVAKDAELAVKMILEAMAESLAKGERIEIRGFGSFGLNYRPPRTGRNPKSGDKVQVPEKHVPHFKAGKELRERVDFKSA